MKNKIGRPDISFQDASNDLTRVQTQRDLLTGFIKEGIFDSKGKVIEKNLIENLQNVFDLEKKVFPCLVDMKFKGVRVDVEKANQTKNQLATKEKQILSNLKKETGIDVEIWAAASIARVFDKLKLPYDRTEKSKAPSFTKNSDTLSSLT